MNYVYLRSESNVYTVGFYEPNGKWNPESDHNNSDEAAERVRWLNGGQDQTAIKRPGSWISVADMLPEAGKDALCWDGHIFIAHRAVDWLGEGYWADCDIRCHIDGITHWQLLPQPPTK